MSIPNMSEAKNKRHRQRQRLARKIAYADSRFPHAIPPRSWDSHMHAVDPGQYPLSPDAKYIPQKHTLADAMAFESRIGISNIVLVQPSIYGFDNSCLLAALKELGPKNGRGVVTIDPDSPPDRAVLQEWHRLGVRGVRLNLQSVGKKLSPQDLATTLRRHAYVIRPFNWVLQLYISMDNVPVLSRIVPELRVKVCLDHFASPDLRAFKGRESSFDPYSLCGFSELITLLRQGNTYVKISGAYRLSADPEMQCVRAMARELMSVAPTRLVFATDWPHTQFDGLDIMPFIEECLSWSRAGSGLRERLFRRNAEELWDVQGTDENYAQRL